MAAAAAPSLSQESLVKRVGSSEMEFLVRVLAGLPACLVRRHPSPSACSRFHALKKQAEETVVEIEARFQHPALRLIRVRPFACVSVPAPQFTPITPIHT